MVATPVATQLAAESVTAPKVLAFVLPQFHSIPENDEWWGKGFTEWTNVRKSKPLFGRHYQPRVPAENRYYDLTDPAVHDWQAALAQAYGLHGFCYYHYWFNGKRLLEKPVEIFLQRGAPDMPFCLAWANEPWTRAWDGSEQQVLMPQTYGDESDWVRHFDSLLEAFRDPRYIRVNGKPMFLIYRSASIQVCEPMLQCWRELAQRAGLPGLHIVGMLTGFDRDRRPHMFDAFAEFEPMFTIRHGMPYWLRKREKWTRRMTKAVWSIFRRGPWLPNSYDYASLWKLIAERELRPKTYPGAFVDWDNSARRGLHRSIFMRNFDRSAFEAGIRAQVSKARRVNAEFLFVNAWNEWAEGAYLEPDEGRGLFFLETLRAALTESQAGRTDE